MARGLSADAASSASLDEVPQFPSASAVGSFLRSSSVTGVPLSVLLPEFSLPVSQDDLSLFRGF